jgi:hypothetical protein
LENLGVDGWIILKCILKTGRGEELWTWINLTRDRDQWRTPVNTVINPLAPIKGREFLYWLSDYYLHKKEFAI